MAAAGRHRHLHTPLSPGRAPPPRWMRARTSIDSHRVGRCGGAAQSRRCVDQAAAWHSREQYSAVLQPAHRHAARAPHWSQDSSI